MVSTWRASESEVMTMQHAVSEAITQKRTRSVWENCLTGYT